MQTFTEVLAGVARRGEAVNTVFEERLFHLISILDKITGPLKAAGVPYALVRGLAVLIHVEQADPTHSVLTRDVDLLVERSDLERVKEIAGQSGFRFRHAAGLDMLVFGASDTPKNAVHLVFSGEKVRPTQVVPNPPIEAEPKAIHGCEVLVMPVRELVKMKLAANRDKDRVHIRSMDAASLITPEVERGLPEELRLRLKRIRETE